MEETDTKSIITQGMIFYHFLKSKELSLEGKAKWNTFLTHYQMDKLIRKGQEGSWIRRRSSLLRRSSLFRREDKDLPQDEFTNHPTYVPMDD